mmetsp:Transcript_18586/g.31682  ORF Transcript_18586/g.31682 Transcript_18586/m.31682 type:complete len:103 (-) Transcript_18586:189-497(-)
MDICMIPAWEAACSFHKALHGTCMEPAWVMYGALLCNPARYKSLFSSSVSHVTGESLQYSECRITQKCIGMTLIQPGASMGWLSFMLCDGQSIYTHEGGMGA